MTVVEPVHLSYSSLNTYTSCPRSFYLSKLKQAEGLPAWYFIIGSAVHDCIETHLEGGSPSVEARFMTLVEEAMDVEPDTSLWLAGGSKDDPVVEYKALEQAKQCFDAAVEYLEDFTPWAVEVNIEGHLPGCGMPIAAFPDAVGEHKKHGPLIIDWKTGVTRGKRDQLETYRALLEVGQSRFPWLKSVPAKGQFVMLHESAPSSRPLLLKETPASLGKRYGEVENKIRRGIYPAKPDFSCTFCTMKPNCKTQSGPTPRARYYDTPTADGKVPF